MFGKCGEIRLNYNDQIAAGGNGGKEKLRGDIFYGLSLYKKKKTFDRRTRLSFNNNNKNYNIIKYSLVSEILRAANAFGVVL